MTQDFLINPGSAITPLPEIAARALAHLPLTPIRLLVRRIVDHLAHSHPALFDRLGSYQTRRFLIDPTDLPFVFLLEPRRDAPRMQVLRRTALPASDARIAGPFAALAGMLQGTLDGDALFFSGDIIIEGDTEAVLALRNAADDAEIDLISEICALAGPLSGAVQPPIRLFASWAERLSGVALSRPSRNHW
jgi:predicted lipid carrier protein YhbT